MPSEVAVEEQARKLKAEAEAREREARERAVAAERQAVEAAAAAARAARGSGWGGDPPSPGCCCCCCCVEFGRARGDGARAAAERRAGDAALPRRRHGGRHLRVRGLPRGRRGGLGSTRGSFALAMNYPRRPSPSARRGGGDCALTLLEAGLTGRRRRCSSRTCGRTARLGGGEGREGAGGGQRRSDDERWGTVRRDGRRRSGE